MNMVAWFVVAFRMICVLSGNRLKSDRMVSIGDDGI